ncbi:MAG: hypothetical protein IPP17_05015 [Bacteroidetes bacterium]|nr:hypothetical protein [Bacteroidota bacterium]
MIGIGLVTSILILLLLQLSGLRPKGRTLRSTKFPLQRYYDAAATAMHIGTYGLFGIAPFPWHCKAVSVFPRPHSVHAT